MSRAQVVVPRGKDLVMYDLNTGADSIAATMAHGRRRGGQGAPGTLLGGARMRLPPDPRGTCVRCGGGGDGLQELYSGSSDEELLLWGPVLPRDVSDA